MLKPYLQNDSIASPRSTSVTPPATMVFAKIEIKHDDCFKRSALTFAVRLKFSQCDRMYIHSYSRCLINASRLCRASLKYLSFASLSTRNFTKFSSIISLRQSSACLILSESLWGDDDKGEILPFLHSETRVRWASIPSPWSCSCCIRVRENFASIMSARINSGSQSAEECRMKGIVHLHRRAWSKRPSMPCAYSCPLERHRRLRI